MRAGQGGRWDCSAISKLSMQGVAEAEHGASETLLRTCVFDMGDVQLQGVRVLFFP